MCFDQNKRRYAFSITPYDNVIAYEWRDIKYLKKENGETNLNIIRYIISPKIETNSIFLFDLFFCVTF